MMEWRKLLSELSRFISQTLQIASGLGLFLTIFAMIEIFISHGFLISPKDVLGFFITAGIFSGLLVFYTYSSLQWIEKLPEPWKLWYWLIITSEIIGLTIVVLYFKKPGFFLLLLLVLLGLWGLLFYIRYLFLKRERKVLYLARLDLFYMGLSAFLFYFQIAIYPSLVISSFSLVISSFKLIKKGNGIINFLLSISIIFSIVAITYLIARLPLDLAKRNTVSPNSEGERKKDKMTATEKLIGIAILLGLLLFFSDLPYKSLRFLYKGGDLPICYSTKAEPEVFHKAILMYRTGNLLMIRRDSMDRVTGEECKEWLQGMREKEQAEDKNKESPQAEKKDEPPYREFINTGILKEILVPNYHWKGK